MDKKEEEHKDLRGAIDLKKLVAYLASLCIFSCLCKAGEKGINYRIC